MFVLPFTTKNVNNLPIILYRDYIILGLSLEALVQNMRNSFTMVHQTCKLELCGTDPISHVSLPSYLVPASLNWFSSSSPNLKISTLMSDISAFGLLRCWWVLRTGRNMPRERKGQSGSASATCQSTPTRVCTSWGWYRPRGCQCRKSVTTLQGFFNPKMWWLCTSAMQTTSVDGCSGMDKLDRTSKAQGQSVC